MDIVLKIILSCFLLFYLFLYYEQIVEFAQLQAYGGENWQNISAIDDECNCAGSKNCFAHPDDSNLCGKCFATCYENHDSLLLPSYQNGSENHQRVDETVFALSASQQDVNKLLVLVASIHRNFPKMKLIIFDKENSTFLRNQLISIRNVEVLQLRSPGKVQNGILTPFYLQEALDLYSKVVWLSVDLEFHNAKFLQNSGFGKSSKIPITFISRDNTRKVAISGYRQFFPSSAISPNFPLAVLLKSDAKTLIKWVEKCALDYECWKCETSSGLVEDCTWMVLYRVATGSDKKQLRLIEDLSSSLQKQSWAPPECDFLCASYMIVMTFGVVIAVVVLVIVLLNRSMKKLK